MESGAMVKRFENYLKFEKGASEHTLRAYLDDLQLLADFMEDTPVEECTEVDARAFVMSRVEGGESPTTINRRMSSLRSFFKFLLREGVVQKSPVQKLRSLRTPSRLPNYLPQEQTNPLISSMESDLQGVVTHSWGADMAYPVARDATIVMMLYYAGLRRSELASLRLGDMDLKSQTLRVLGKGGKERIVPINQALGEVLRKYLEKREEFCCEIDSDFLFLGRNRGGLRGDAVYKIVNRVLKGATTGVRPSPHTLRHTFATHLLSSDVSIRTIQELLGHSSIASTQIYAHTTIEGLKRSHEKAHPRSKRGDK